MDKEQQKEGAKAKNQISKELQIQQFARSDDWKHIKKKLFDKLLELDSLSVLFEGMKYPTIKKIGEQSYINGKVCSVIIDWITEIEGTLVSENREFMKGAREENFIIRDED